LVGPAHSVALIAVVMGGALDRRRSPWPPRTRQPAHRAPTVRIGLER